jgi:hypothetical protein
MSIRFSLLAILTAGFLCQCQTGYKPDFISNPNQLLRADSTTAESIAILARPPAQYQELGNVSASQRNLLPNTNRRRWERAIATMKEQTADMGADAIVVTRLRDYDQASISEAYLGMEGASYTPGSASSQLKPEGTLHGLAIRLP